MNEKIQVSNKGMIHVYWLDTYLWHDRSFFVLSQAMKHVQEHPFFRSWTGIFTIVDDTNGV